MTPLAWPSLPCLAIITGLAAAVVLLAISRHLSAARLATFQQRFFECMERAPFCAYIKDTQGCYLYANPALVDITRIARPDLHSFLGHTDHELFPGGNAAQYSAEDQQVLQLGTPLLFDNSSVDADGSVRYWTTMKFPWFDAQGRACVAGISYEITEIFRARQAAKSSEDRYALALEAGRMGSMSLNLLDGTIETSPLFAVLHGRPESRTRLTLAESLADVHPDDHSAIMAALDDASRRQEPGRMLYRVVKNDGSIAWIEFVGQVFTDDEGRPASVRGVGFDVTERQAAYDELARRKQMLRRLIDVQENERQTLCHELHDGMMQYTIAAKMLLEAMRDGASSSSQADQFNAAVDCLDRGIAEGRQVIRGVRSAVLDDLGLAAAIGDLADQMTPFGIAVDIDIAGDVDSLPPPLRTTIYRVVQESLTNVRKHAVTDRASVAIERTPDTVRLHIRDEGHGFTIDQSRRQGFGLMGMMERVRLAGGRFTIDSRPGAGAHIDVCLPINLASMAAGDADAERPIGTAAAVETG